MYDQFFIQLQKLIELNEEDEIILRKYWKKETYKKNEFLVEEGKVCTKIVFPYKGYFRIYVMKDINETTIHIGGNSDFISSYASFIQQCPSHEFVQAVTNVECLSITRSALEELYSLGYKWERLGRLIMEALFVRKEARVTSLIKNSAQVRYNELIENQPDIVHNVSLQHIASYLGVKPETLSRIRAKK